LWELQAAIQIEADNELAQSIMAGQNHALVVIAPHRDFADELLGLVPESRAEDVAYGSATVGV